MLSIYSCSTDEQDEFKLIKYAHKQKGESDNVSYDDFWMLSAIKSFKKAIYMRMFNSRYLKEAVDDLVEHSKCQIGSAINSFANLSKWIFEGDQNSNETIIFNNSSEMLWFDARDSAFLWKRGDDIQSYTDINLLLQQVRSAPTSFLLDGGIDMFSLVCDLLSLLKSVQKINPTGMEI